MTLLLEHMWYLCQGENLGKHLFDLLLKTQTTKGKVFHLVYLYFGCCNLAGKEGISISSKRESNQQYVSQERTSLWIEGINNEHQSPQCFGHRKWFLIKIRFLDHDSVVKDIENLLKMFKAYFWVSIFSELWVKKWADANLISLTKASALQS